MKKMKQNDLENRIAQIESREETNAKTIIKMFTDLEAKVYCGAIYGHRFTLLRYTGDGYFFRCTKCALEYYKPEEKLNQIEKDLVAAVFSKQEQAMKGKK